MNYAIETFSLTKIFSDWWGRQKVCAVDDLSLQVNYNEVFGLLGPNGSGKTTTIKLLLSLLHPTKGRALILGGDSTDSRINARVGFMPEESYLYKYLSARETLDFYGKLFIYFTWKAFRKFHIVKNWIYDINFLLFMGKNQERRIILK